MITNSVSATDTFLTLATKSGSDNTAGTLTTNYVLDPANPKYDNTPGIKLYKQIMAKYNPKGNVSDGLNVYGMAKAWNIVQVLQAAGKNLTRAGLMKAARNMAFTTKLKNANPFLLPGVDIAHEGQLPVPDLSGDAGAVPEQRVPADRQADQRPRRLNARPLREGFGPPAGNP